MIDQGRSVWNDFKSFLIKQNVLALALAVVVGAALNGVVKSVVDDIIMPIVAFATPEGDWRAYKFQVGSVAFGLGNLAANLLNFLIVGLVAWRITKVFIKPAPATVADPAPATKNCEFCRMSIDALATRCPHCTSELVPANV